MAHDKKAKKIIRTLYIVFLWIMIIFILAFSLIQVFYPDKSIEIFGIHFYLVSYTKSMEPELNENDLIAVVRYDFEDCQIGDIITFEATTNDGQLITVTHKIVRIGYDINGVKYVQTKGTNIELPDLTPVTEHGIDGTNKYIGKYSFKSVFLGNMLAYLRSSYGLVALFVTIAGFAAIYIMFKKSNIEESSKNDEENDAKKEQKNKQKIKKKATKIVVKNNSSVVVDIKMEKENLRIYIDDNIYK